MIGAGMFALSMLCSSVSAQYCNSSATDKDFEHISKVQLNEIVNSSESSLYTDYTAAASTILYIGEKYEMLVVTEQRQPTDKLACWIDWNQNQVFDAEEKIMIPLTGEFSQQGIGKVQLILPEEAKKVRPDAILATGRSDYPNQVNNVLCFPYIFRGALDVGATDINDEMKLACVKALADMAHIEASDVVTEAYGGQAPTFGPEYLIPKPFDPRLIVELPPAVAKAAIETGVATRPIDIDKYREKMAQFVFRSNLVMKPVFERARHMQRRLAFAEGENERVLQAVQTVVDENLARPILIGRRDVVVSRIERLGLRLVIDQDFELVDPEGDRRFSDYWRTYHELMARKGVTPESAKVIVRTRATVIAALMVHLGDADALICGTIGGFDRHYRHIIDVIGLRDDVTGAATMSGLILPKGTFFITDPYVRQNPTPEEIAEQTIMAADEIQRFGLTPKIALLSHSNFGSRDGACAEKVREAMRLLDRSVPHLEIEGEMQGDAAVYEDIRKAMFPDSRLKGQANLFVMPSIEAANISFNLLKALGDGLSIGPILLGTAKSAHVLQPSATVRAIVNMSALAAVDVPEEKA